MAACRAVEVTTAEMTSEDSNAGADKDVGGSLSGFVLSGNTGGELEIVV